MNANNKETAQPTDERNSSSHGAMKNPTQPSGQRRSLCHDYYAPGTYMLTIVTEERVRLLGHIEGTARNRAMGQLPHMVLSALGRRVLEEEIPKIPRLYPNVEVWRVAFMPDHIHLLVRVTAPFPKGKHLGLVVSGFKSGCSQAWWRLLDEAAAIMGRPVGEPTGTMAQPPTSATAAAPVAAATAPAVTTPTPAAVGPAAGPAPAAATTPVVSTPAPAAPAAVGPAAGLAATAPAVSTPAAPAAVSPAPVPPVVGPAALWSMPGMDAGLQRGICHVLRAVVPEGSPSGSLAGPASGGVVAASCPSHTPLRPVSRKYPAHWACYPLLFAVGYHDRIIRRHGMLDNIKRYMLENPLRARIREECPQLMQRRLHLWVAGREYAAFGNLFLLKYPLKQQVFFHRYSEPGSDDERQRILASDALTDKERAHMQADPRRVPTHLTEAYREVQARLLREAEEGTVLVTPGISKGEHLVADAAIDGQLPLIILQNRLFGPYWKPEQRRFYACAAGRLLILAPWQLDGDTDYDHFHRLNDYARELCDATDMRIIGYSQLVGR